MQFCWKEAGSLPFFGDSRGPQKSCALDPRSSTSSLLQHAGAANLKARAGKSCLDAVWIEDGVCVLFPLGGSVFLKNSVYNR